MLDVASVECGDGDGDAEHGDAAITQRPDHGRRTLALGRVAKMLALASVGQYFVRTSGSGSGNAGAIPGTSNSAPTIVDTVAALERVGFHSGRQGLGVLMQWRSGRGTGGFARL